MHLASSSLTPTIGLFSVASEKKYHPYQNNSVAFNTNNNTTLDCLKIIDRILLNT